MGATSTRTRSRKGNRKSSGGRGAGPRGRNSSWRTYWIFAHAGAALYIIEEGDFDFFADYNSLEESICLTHRRSDGRATGEGYIAFFCSPDDAKEAMALHRNTMGQRYIELFISNKDEYGRAQAREPPLEE